MSKQSVIIFIVDKLYAWLDEAWSEYSGGYESEFLLGKIYAYIECLEIILQSEGIDNEELLALEEKYGIK